MCRQLHLIQHCLEYLLKTTSDKVAGECCPLNKFENMYTMNHNVRPFPPPFFDSRSCDQSDWDIRPLQPLTERTEGHSLLPLYGADENLGESNLMSQQKYNTESSSNYNVHSIALFLLLKAPHSILLVGALNNMAVNVQPDVFFSFSGQPGAVS